MAGERTTNAADAIRGVVEAWQSGSGPAPRVQRTCTRCGTRLEVPLSEPVRRVVRDHPIGGFTADVALLGDAGVVGYLELVDDERLSNAKLRRLDAPHLVLSITDVLQDPARWLPLPSTARAWQCDACLEGFRAIPPVTLPVPEAIAASLQLSLPSAPYHSAVVRCFRCQRPSLVHRWDGHVAYGPEAPPSPIPVGLRRVFTADAHDYHLANHCLHCGATQPDGLLYGHRTGPFWTSDEDYERGQRARSR